MWRATSSARRLLPFEAELQMVRRARNGARHPVLSAYQLQRADHRVLLGRHGHAERPAGREASSHNQPLFDQYDKGGNWTGMLSDEDAATIDMSGVPYLMGPAAR